MTDINLNNLPLAKRGQTLNRVIGTQVDDDGVPSLALFPLKTLSATGGRIARLAITTTPAPAGAPQDATLIVYTDDGNSYPVIFTIPPGARGFSVGDVACEQDEVKPGEACRVRITLTLDNGEKLPPMVLTLPPGKDSLTVTDTSVTQDPVEPGKPSRVTVTSTHSDGSQASYSYDAPPGAEGFVDKDSLVLSTPASQSGSAVENIVWDHEKKQLGALSADKSWHMFYPVEESLRALTYSDQDARPTTVRVLKKSYNGTPQLIIENDGAPDFVGASLDHVSTVVAAETQRAQTAEATKIPSSPSSDQDTAITNIVWNHKEKQLGALSADQSWHMFYPVEESLRALTYSDQDARPTTIRVLKKSYNGTPQLIIENDGAPDFVGASLDHVSTVIAAETQRAQAAEADTVKTQTNASDHKVDLLVYNYPGQTLAAHDSQTGLWSHYNTTDNSVRTITYSDADAKPTTIRTVKNGTSGHPTLCIEHDGFGPVAYASEDYVKDMVNNNAGQVQARDPGKHSRSKLYFLSFNVTGLRDNFSGRIAFPAPIQGAGKDGSELVSNPNNVVITFNIVSDTLFLGAPSIYFKNINGTKVADITDTDFNVMSPGTINGRHPATLIVMVTYWGD